MQCRLERPEETGTKEITKLATVLFDSNEETLLEIFESYGFPLVIESDNGPQFRESFKAFCKGIGVPHTPSSAYNPASNGLSESAVKIAKRILKKAKASNVLPSAALHAWRNLPRADAVAPSDLLFGFRQRTPLSPPKLCPAKFVNREEKAAARHELKESTYRKRGGTILKQLPQGSSAVLQDKEGRWREEVTVGPTRDPGRSYVIFKEDGDELVRNRRFLRPRTPAT